MKACHVDKADVPATGCVQRSICRTANDRCLPLPDEHEGPRLLEAHEASGRRLLHVLAYLDFLGHTSTAATRIRITLPLVQQRTSAAMPTEPNPQEEGRDDQAGVSPAPSPALGRDLTSSIRVWPGMITEAIEESRHAHLRGMADPTKLRS